MSHRLLYPQRRHFAVIAWATFVFVSACDSDVPEPEPWFPLDAPSVWPESRNCRLSSEHNLQYVRVFANDEARPFYDEGPYPFAVGAMLVKAEYDDPQCSSLAGFTAMRKAQPADQASDGWSWQRVSASGVVLEEGALGKCSSCHSATCPETDLACTHK